MPSHPKSGQSKSDFPQPEREIQAKREIGVTDISGLCARVLSIAFLVVIGSLLILDPAIRRFVGVSAESEAIGTPFDLARELGATVIHDFQQLGGVGLVATNRLVMKAMSVFEGELEEDSAPRQLLLAPVQWRLLEWLGLGNEKAYLGRDGWLFYRPDIDYVTGQGFLEPAVLQARARGGDPWIRPPEPDPMPALLDFRRQLESRGIELLVVPTPVKPTLYPETFSPRAERSTGALQPTALQNESFDEFLSRAAAAGIDVFDPTQILSSSKRAPVDESGKDSGSELFLRTDTHWTPQAVDLVAQSLSETLTGALSESLSGAIRAELDADLGGRSWVRRSVVLEGFGDIAKMLWVPTDQSLIAPDRVKMSMVTSQAGQVWRSDPKASILILGDSFTNVYSDPGLGWGLGAGLAEQIAFHLALPIDRIARNAGGALGSRQALQQALQQDPYRLENKRLVIYQFSTRELSQGDWRLVDLGSAP